MTLRSLPIVLFRIRRYESIIFVILLVVSNPTVGFRDDKLTNAQSTFYIKISNAMQPSSFVELPYIETPNFLLDVFSK